MPKRLAVLLLLLASFAPLHAQGVVRGGALPPPLPLFRPDNPWNVDISTAPVDTAATTAYITNFIGTGRALHPDFGGDSGDVAPNPLTYGMPYIVVPGTQPLVPVTFDYADESDAGAPGRPAGYPIPDAAKSGDRWVEGGLPCDSGADGDRHMLIVDRDNRILFELWATRFNTALNRWEAGSGATFRLDSNGRRPEGWTSADAAGLAVLPGLVRRDEVVAAEPIRHAFRVTTRSTNGHVYPASHDAGNTSGAPPMGTRLRLKASKDISPFPADVQKIFQAMKTYGLIVADNGSDMYVQGTYDVLWNNDVLNPAFGQLHAGDFEVITPGYFPDYLDVPPSHTFHAEVVRLGKAAVTNGCSAGYFCPDVPVLRSQMAVFLLRGMHSSAFVPPPATGTRFADVPPSAFAADFIEQLAAEGVTRGCDPTHFCPDRTLTRAENAVFLLRALLGSSYVPPPATGVFSDVPASDQFAPWIEDIYRRGITNGCAPGRYCPDGSVTRGQMAAFVVRTFSLP